MKGKHTTFRISEELLEKLHAQCNPNGIGDEIRKRLENSFLVRCKCGRPQQKEWIFCPTCGSEN